MNLLNKSTGYRVFLKASSGIFLLLLGSFISCGKATLPSRADLRQARELLTMSEALLKSPHATQKRTRVVNELQKTPDIEGAKRLFNESQAPDLKAADTFIRTLTPGPRCQARSFESLSALRENLALSKEPDSFGRKRTLAPFYVFVTLSMQDDTLKALYRSTHKIGGRLVIRGLIDNDFKKTQKRLLDLKIGVEIDPPLFNTFKITRVPTFVLLGTSLETGGGVPSHDRLQGNVSVFYALSQFKEQGEIPGVQTLLDGLGE